MSLLLRRSLFYVPASSPRFIAKSLNLQSDNVTYDLEDSVSAAEKPAARNELVKHLGSITPKGRPSRILEVAARVNPLGDAAGIEDLAALAHLPQLDALVIPKVEGADVMLHAAVVLNRAAAHRREAWGELHAKDRDRPPCRPISIIALVESARGVEELRGVCTALPRYASHSESEATLSGLVFGAEDFAHDMGMSIASTTRAGLDALSYARARVVGAARAWGVPGVADLVCTKYKNDAVLTAQCADGRRLGFNGKQVVHPEQLDVVNEAFGVSADDLKWAVKVVVANAAAEREGLGAFELDGGMVDAPVVARAKAFVERARLCGTDVDALMGEWECKMAGTAEE